MNIVMSIEMNIERIDHFVLTVHDVAASCAFYERVLGIQVITFDAGRKALRFGQHKINLHPVEGHPPLVAARPMPGSADFCLITRVPLPQVIEHLHACGVEIVAGPGERAGALGPIQSVYFRDPDGNLVEVSNEADGQP